MNKAGVDLSYREQNLKSFKPAQLKLTEQDNERRESQESQSLFVYVLGLASTLGTVISSLCKVLLKMIGKASALIKLNSFWDTLNCPHIHRSI